MMFTPEQIGRVGELKFDELCNETSIVSSEQHPDLLGIDRYVEFPAPLLDPYSSLDTRPAALSCYVQIKTISSNQSSWRISLAVAERLAKSVKPSFVVLFRLGDEGKVQSAVLAHVRAKLLERILKRLRAIDPNTNLDINRRYISLSESDGIRIELNGVSLATALADAIGPSMDQYSRDKENERSTLGFPEYRYKIKVVLPPTDYEELVEAFLESKPLRFEKMEVFEERFSITRPAAPGKILGGTFTAGPAQPREIRLKIASLSSDKVIEIPCRMRVPGIPNVPTEHQKYKIDGEIIKITATDRNITVKISSLNDSNVKHSIETWNKAFFALHLLATDSCRISFTELSDSITYVLGDSELIDSTEMIRFADLRILTSALRWLYEAARLPDEPLSLPTLKSVEDEALIAHAILTGSTDVSPLSFELPPERAASAGLSSSIPMAFVSGVPIGEKVIAYSVRTVCSLVQGTSEWRSDKFVPISVRVLEEPDLVAAYKQYAGHVQEITGADGIMVRELIKNPAVEIGSDR